MSTDTTVSPLRQRMIEDMAARKLGRHAQRSHIHSCRRFAAFLERSPDTATADDVRRFQLHLVESELSIGPKQVLRYLSRYTHRVAISNRRLVAADANAITFRWKDYRIDRPDRWKTMTLCPHEFIRRFLMHVLPKGFHRIRHYGLFANGNRAANVARCRELLGAMLRVVEPAEEQA